MTKTISISAPAPARLALEALAALLEVKLVVVIEETNENASPVQCQLFVEETHPLATCVSTSLEVKGWMPCIKYLCLHSVLWGDDSPLTQAQVEAWLLEGEAHLLHKESFDAQGFCDKLERHFVVGNQTYLVGDLPTAADVCLAIWICTLTVEKLQVSQQCHRWLSTIVHNSTIQRILLQQQQQVDIPTMKQQESSPTPVQDKVEKKNNKKETTPPVVVRKETPTTTTTTPSSPASLVETTTSPKEETTPAAATPVVVVVSTTHDTNNPILALLDEYKIEYTHYHHETCMTAEELVEHVPLPSLHESHCKNLFLRDKKHGLFLVVCKPTTVIHTKSLGGMLALQGKTNFRLADNLALEEILGVQPGCVGPLCIVNDQHKQVTLVLDQALMEFDKVHSHPLYNDQSVSMTPAALQTYLDKVGAKVIILDFTNTNNESCDVVTPKPPPPPPSSSSVSSSNKPKAVPKKGETLLALQWKKEENFAMWYSDVIVLSEMISYYDISGCYILRPWSYKIWELIQEWFNGKIQEKGVENSYFPLFVSQDRLEKEKDHVEGFAPEVAWVTMSGTDTLAKPIAVRPTSETIMYPAFSDWIKSHRDLPLKLNQWSNVVRWEFKDPTPFLRSREFLWQEGHTAHSTFEDADAMVMQGLEWYRGVYEELLAVPVIKGYKTEKEKFAGGFQTTTCEAYIPGSGRAIQGATSHNLGQNFGKMFDISFQDEKGQSQIAWQTSWGLTTRSIGVMIMVHGDDTGLVLPPRVAPLQVVIVPIISKKLLPEQAAPYCEAILADLKATGLRAKYDDRTMYNPGWKYNHWEQKGVPIRIEVGPRDIEQNQARIVIRYSGEKMDMSVDNNLGASIKLKLEEIQNAMFIKAKETRDKHLVQITQWKDFVPNLERNNLVMTPWCGGEHTDWEDWVKNKSREESLQARGAEQEDARTATSVAAKTLCIPFEQPPMPEGTKCIASDIPATCWILWGRSY